MRILFTILLLTCSYFASANGMSVRFERLLIEDGLSQSSVESVIHDNKGFLWLATHDGLNRYDGYQFKHFRHDPQNPNSLSNSFVTIIYEDSQGQLWVGTKGGGLNRFDADTQTFTRFVHDDVDLQSLSHNYVTSIVEDQQGTLWVGTLGGGLNQFDTDTGKFLHFKASDNGRIGLSHNMVRSILEDSLGNLWIGTEGGGVNRFDTRTGRFKHYRHSKSDNTSLSHDVVYDIAEDTQGTIWVGTYGGGLNRFDRKSQTFSAFRYESNNPNSLSYNKIWSLEYDKDGGIWVGTDGQGLSFYDVKQDKFTHFKHQSSDSHSLSHNSIRAIYQDDKGLLWVGTFGAGVNRVGTRQRYFGHHKHQVEDSTSLSSDIIMSIFEDSRGGVWAGTWGAGVNYQRSQTSGFVNFRHRAGDENSLSHNSVWAINEDNQGNVWIGSKAGLSRFNPESQSFTNFGHDPNNLNSLSHGWIMNIFVDDQDILWLATRGGGLNRFDKKSNTFTHYRHKANDENSLSSDSLLDVFGDDEGILWIGSWGGGFNKLDPKTLKITRYLNNKQDPYSISDNYLMTGYKDSDGFIWIGTFGGGLNKFNPQTEKFMNFREKDGLGNDTVYSILEDDNKNLWLSTNRGLSKFNPRSGVFKLYDVNDGLQSNEFNGGAHYKSNNGELYFGGIKGFNRFYPSLIEEDKQPPSVIFTDFLLFNQTVEIKAEHHKNAENPRDSIFTLSQSIEGLEQLDIGHKENLVTFEFSALDYSNPMKNQYKYKMEGLDEKWVKADAKIRRATYTNLPSGEYVLRVKASNPDGYWNDRGASIQINVSPPPWLSWWAYSIYFVVLSLIILKFILYRIERNKVRNERMMLHHLKQVDKLKDDFLANTSHELRTPLNGIIGLAESLIDGIDGELPDKAKRTLSMVVTSGRRLASLINDILDLSKLKHSNIELSKQPLDIRALTDVVLTLSKPLVSTKPVRLINEIPEKIVAVEADENRLLQILHNLVGNGIKFTESGAVTVSAVEENEFVTIAITDTGVGISEDKFDSIFESFEQAQGDIERQYGGTGLGLTITKQLIELHGGNIKVSSILGQGSTFTFTLPVSLSESSSAINAKTNQIETTLIAQLDEAAEEELVFDNVGHDGEGGQFRILLVDDEPINIHVLKNYLSNQNYQMVEAQDGLQALQAIENNGPFDMVLLDIMMPKMSGYEVCKIIRETYSVSDLPVLFLTASNQVDDVVQGFAVGANDHLNKPVAKHELLSRVGTHLRLLDINRNLENRVMERTVEVEQQNERLEHKNQQMQQALDKLVLSEKLASLGALMAGVAHEINHPTNYVVFSVETLKDDLQKCREYIFKLTSNDTDPDIIDSIEHKFEPLEEHVAGIKEGVERVRTIIKDLQTSTRMGDLEKISVNVTDILMSTINLVSAEYKEHVELITELTDVPEIICHPSKLSQVFMNLIVNACDAVKQRAQLEEVDIEQVHGQIIISCQQVRHFVEIQVKDNGCGMNEEALDNLFEPFLNNQSDEQDSGLSLSISRDIIHSQGGKLTVESQVNKGTVFKVVMPIDVD